MALKQDIDFIKGVLPDHYQIKESKKPGLIHCKSLIGIPDDPPDQRWRRIFNKIKAHFGNRFQEVFHNTCTNHIDFTIYLK